jgi:hypothetical protein
LEEDEDFLKALGVIPSVASPGRRIGAEATTGRDRVVESSRPPKRDCGSEVDLAGSDPAPFIPGSRRGVLSCSKFRVRVGGGLLKFIRELDPATSDGLTEEGGKDRTKSLFTGAAFSGVVLDDLSLGSPGHLSNTVSFLSELVGLWIFWGSSGVEDNLADAWT